MQQEQRKEDSRVQRRDRMQPAQDQRSAERPEERATYPPVRRECGTQEHEQRRDDRTRQRTEQTDGNATFDRERGRLPGGERDDAHPGARSDAKDHEAETGTRGDAREPLTTTETRR